MNLPLTAKLKATCAALGRKYVGFRGNPHSPIWFIGEAPGADEDQTGVPFVGASGRELDRMIQLAGIPASACCFTNPFKVRPPQNDLSRFSETGISVDLSREQFFEEIRAYRPSFIVACGGTPLSLLCPATIDSRDKESKISKWRGSILQPEGFGWPCYVIPNFHPAYILREWSDRDVSIFILRRVMEEFGYWKQCGKHLALPQRELISNPSQGEIEDYLRTCLAVTGPISVDIELLARKVPICCSFSYQHESAISISLFDGDPRNLARTWRLMDKIFREKWLVGQNFTTFDSNWLEALGFKINMKNVDDTLVLHHILHPELSHKLDFQGMQFTRLPFWKDDGKSWNLRDGMTKLKRYNALDAAATLEIFEREIEELIESTGTRGGIDSLQSEPTLAAGFGLEGQTVLRDLASARIKEPNSLLESSTNFSERISNLESSFTTVAKTGDASILGTPSSSLTKNTEQSTKELRKAVFTDMNSQQKTQSTKEIKEDVESVAEGSGTEKIQAASNLFDFYRYYEMPLARAFQSIDKRGILTDAQALAQLRKEILEELDKRVVEVSGNLNNRPVVYSAAMGAALSRQLRCDAKAILNIASVPQLKQVLVNELHIKLKTDRQTGKETTGEESLNEAFAATGHPVLKDVLRIRELNKILGTYIDARLGYEEESCGNTGGTEKSRKQMTVAGSGSEQSNCQEDMHTSQSTERSAWSTESPTKTNTDQSQKDIISTINAETKTASILTTSNPSQKQSTTESMEGSEKAEKSSAANGVLYSCYSVTGTVTGRRASRKNFLGLGTNGQNQPKHSDLGERFQRIFIARPGHIYAYCDQASAEEWIVQGIIADVSGDDHGIRELNESIRTGISRHAVLASQIFGLPIAQTNNKECLEYYIGKKVRHAGNYDMREDKMAAVMAAEGFPVKKDFCAAVLDKFHAVEPSIRGVFHKYVQYELVNNRMLKTPLGRERVFHSLRPYGDNSKVFREAYSYIPQSTIGDNNGMAILYMHTNHPGLVLMDGHDSILCECKDNLEDLSNTLHYMQKAYKRVLKFPNGFEVEVPIDFKVGYSMQGLVKINDTTDSGVASIYEACRSERLLDLERNQNSRRLWDNEEIRREEEIRSQDNSPSRL